MARNTKKKKADQDSSKIQQLAEYQADNTGKTLTTNQGLALSDDQDSLKAGVRGPHQLSQTKGGFVSVPAKMDTPKIRGKSEKFFDHFSQAALFFKSQSAPEQAHMINAFRFELGKVKREEIRTRMLAILDQVDKGLAADVAAGLGLDVPDKADGPLNHSFPADANPEEYQPKRKRKVSEPSPALSMANTPKDSIRTRKVAFLAADGVDDVSLNEMKKALTAEGALAMIVAPRLGYLKSANGAKIKIDFSLLTTSSVLFDAVYVPGGAASVNALTAEPDAVTFVQEMYKHCKSISAVAEGIELIMAAIQVDPSTDSPEGVIGGAEGRIQKVARDFIKAMQQHRHWSREPNS